MTEMYALVVTIHIKPEHREEYIKALLDDASGQEFGREVVEVADAARGVVHFVGIEREQQDAADAGFFEQRDVPLQLRAGPGRPKGPQVAGHARFRRRVRESSFNLAGRA